MRRAAAVAARRDERGFTLVEILVTLLISVFVIAGIYRSFNTLHQWWITVGVTAEQRQNARAGLDAVTRDLEMAGYRTSTYGDANKAGIAITLAAAGEIEVDQQRPRNDTIAWPNPVYEPRLVYYHLATDVRSGRQNLYRQIRTEPGLAAPDEIVAENVSAFTLAYFDKDGGAVAGLPSSDPGGSAAYTAGVAVPANSPLRAIRRIQVTLTTVAARERPIGTATREYTVTASVQPANLASAAAAAADVTAPAAPTGPSASSTPEVIDTGGCDTKLYVRWNKSTDLDLAGYKLFYGATQYVSVPASLVAGQATPTVLLRPSDLLITKHQYRATAPNTYAIQIAAYDSSGNTSARTTAVSANPSIDVRDFGAGDDTTVNPVKPAPPTGVTAVPGASEKELIVSWSAPADGSASVGYRLFRSTAAFADGHVADALEIKDEQALAPGTTTWTDGGLAACTTYHYAVASVNCDETLVATYLYNSADATLTDYAAGSGTTSAGVAPPAPGLTAAPPTEPQVLLTLENPLQEASPYFARTEIFWSKSPDGAPSLDATNGTVSGGTHLPDSDGGAAGTFTTRGSQVVVFDGEGSADPGSPSLEVGATYHLLAVAYDRCGTASAAVGEDFVIPATVEACVDLPAGAPPESPTDPTYTSCAADSVRLGWRYPPRAYTGAPGSGPLEAVTDFVGYRIARSGTDGEVELMAAPTSSESWTDTGLRSGGEYTYSITAVDCSGNRSTALEVGPVRPGGLRGYEAASSSSELAAENFVTTLSDNPAAYTYHNNVKFHLQNTSRASVTLTKMSVTWTNPDIVLDEVTIGGAPGTTTSRTVSAGKVGSGASIAVNAAIQDLASGVGSPSAAIPVLLRFTTASGAVNRLVDLRGEALGVSLWVRNSSLQNADCPAAQTVTVAVPRGPLLSGFRQDAPGEYGIDAYEVVGSSGTARDDDVVVASGAEVNVFGTALDRSGELFADGVNRGFATLKLVGVTADAAADTAVPAMPATGGTPFERTLYGTGGDGYASYRTSATPNGAKMPVVSDKVNWYYALGIDATGNWDRQPNPDNGAYAYYQQPTETCGGTPLPPVLTLASISSSQAQLTWTAPTRYVEGGTIPAGDALSYDLYLKSNGSEAWPAEPTVAGIGGHGYTHVADMRGATYYYMVRAKNSCSPPRVSGDSNTVLGCSGGTGVDCTLFSVPASAAIGTPFTVGVSSICAYRGNGTLDTVVFRVVSGATTTNLTATESGDEGTFVQTITPVASGGGGSSVVVSGGSLTVSLVVGGTTPCASRTVAVAGDACSTIPSAPTSLAAVSGGSQKVDLTWLAPTTNTDGTSLTDLAGYQIGSARCTDYRGSTCRTWAPWTTVDLTGGSTQLYTWKNLASGNYYKFRIRARDGCSTPNYSAWSAETSALQVK